MNINPCCDQVHGSCLFDIHLMTRGWGKERYRQWTASTMNRHWSYPKMENVDIRPRDFEGVEGADIRRVWLVLVVHYSTTG